MGITLTGDFHELANWASSLKDAGKVMPLIAEQVAEEMRNLTLEGFDKSADPYGKKWRARKGADTGRALLVRTSAMKGSVQSKHGSTWASVRLGQSYANFHQHGTRRMVQRMLVPSDSLPPDWEARFDDVVADTLEHYLG